MNTPALDPIIEVNEFLNLSQKEDTVILDCRGSLTDSSIGEMLFAEGHIPLAQHIDMGKDAVGPRTEKSGRTPLANPHVFACRLQEFGINNTSTVLLYDTENMTLAPRVWFTLRTIGLANAYLLNGGIKAWVDAGLTLEKGVAKKLPQGNITPKVSLERVFSTSEIEENLKTKDFLLIDARGEAMYLGKNPGPDPRGGHIPGSISYPARLNIDSEGRLYDAKHLKEAFMRLSQNHPERILHTCGSGVAACLNLVATRHAKLKTAGVYIGSFSEWIKNPNHPVSTEDED